MACIVRHGDNLSANLGRITVVYVADRGVVRVVGSQTGVVIREDETEPLRWEEFRKIVRQYQTMTTL